LIRARSVAALLGAGAIALGVTVASPAHGTTLSLWTNCTHVHTKYRHGIGRLHAHDHTRSGRNPVTNFFRSTKLYNLGMRHNSDLDRDGDGVACEQH